MSEMRYKTVIRAHIPELDRKDNTLGYIQSNCVTCCKQYNYKKNAQHINDFIRWVLKVANHLKG